MNTTLFPVKEYPSYLLDITFAGPSYDGMMEIGALGKEIEGLENVLRIALHSLKKNKQIEVSLNDLEIYVGAFQKSSFRKWVKVFNKNTKEYQPLINLASVVVMTFGIIPLYVKTGTDRLSPEFIAQVKDTVALELLQDKRFIAAAANVVGSVSVDGDTCTLAAPNEQTVTIDPQASSTIVQLATVEEQPIEDGEHFEILKGRISRVDLDASRRHLGFKVDGEGSTVDGTFGQKPTNDEMKALLGEWAEMKGVVQYIGGQRSHIDIQEYNVIQQQTLEFSENNEN